MNIAGIQCCQQDTIFFCCSTIPHSTFKNSKVNISERLQLKNLNTVSKLKAQRSFQSDFRSYRQCCSQSLPVSSAVCCHCQSDPCLCQRSVRLQTSVLDRIITSHIWIQIKLPCCQWNRVIYFRNRQRVDTYVSIGSLCMFFC